MSTTEATEPQAEEQAENKYQLFRLIDHVHQTCVRMFEMPPELLTEVVDLNTFTLGKLKHGSRYVLDPADEKESAVDTLLALKQQYETYRYTFGRRVSESMVAADEIVDTVGRLFDTVRYPRVETIEDLQYLVHPPSAPPEYKIKHVERGRLDNIFGEAAKQLTINIEDHIKKMRKTLEDARAKLLARYDDKPMNADDADADDDPADGSDPE